MTQILPPYEFRTAPPREIIATHDVAGYAVDPELGSDASAVAVVKWDNQRHHDEYLRGLLADGWEASRGLSNAPNSRARSTYYNGLVARFSLGVAAIDAHNCAVEEMSQPTGFDVHPNGREAFASANTLLIRPLGKAASATTVTHPLFARLHSAEFNPDGSKILTAASAFDMIYEIDVASGTPAWSMDIWEETLLRTNGFGQSLHRYANGPAPGESVLRNPDPLFMKDNEATRGATCVIDDPARYNNLGLPTALMPAFINSVSYGSADTVLATSYQRGEGWIIDRRDRPVQVIATDMKRPHGLHADPWLEGYMVTDTVGEKVRYISGDLKKEVVLDFAGISGMKPGLEKAGWLQYTTRVTPDTYAAVLTSRQKVVLFDPARQVRREIPIDPDWGVQLIAPAHPL